MLASLASRPLAAFPVIRAGRLPRYPFRGLLGVYSRCSPRGFKPQNMSNNAAVCADGGEIGRAQALQARFAGLEPHRDFNPVLLKPQTDRGSHVVVQGRVVGTFDAAGYQAARGRIRASVLESFQRLAADYDLIIVEGAGSLAEVNLRVRAKIIS